MYSCFYRIIHSNFIGAVNQHHKNLAVFPTELTINHLFMPVATLAYVRSMFCSFVANASSTLINYDF